MIIELVYFRHSSFRMKLLLLITCLVVAASQICGQNYSLNGNAIAVGTNCIAVTPNQVWQNGSVWYNDLLDLSLPFTLEFQMNFGTEDANGADGMTFVLQTVGPHALGMDGHGMGFEGLNPSFGIEFDTYYNGHLADITADHIAFHKNGGVNHSQSTNLAGPVVANPVSQNIEDGFNHPIKITWDPVTRIVQLYFDCVLMLSAQVDLVNGIFDGNTQVWWGFTGATGGLWNQQLVCLAETYEFNANLEYTICQGESVQISANGNPDGNYSWLPVTGLSNSLLQSPVASPNIDTEYCYTYVDMCGNTTNGCIQVNVINPPEVSAGADSDFCEGETILLQVTEVPGAMYSWSGPNDFTSSSQNPSIGEASLDMSGEYMVSISLNDCTSSIATTNIIVNETPAPPNILYNGPVCSGDSLFLSTPSSFNTSYTWTGPNGFTSGEQNPVISPNATVDLSGSYTVVATLGECSSMAAETSVIVHPIPEAPVASSNGPVNEGTELVLSASSVPEATYTWTGPNGFTSNEQNPIVSLEATLAMAGIYEVGVTVNACESIVDSVLVVVNTETSVQDRLSVIGVHAYPIPAAENLWIEVPDLSFNSVQLVNSLGAVIMQSTLSYPTTELNIHDFASGVYYLILRGAGKREEVRLIKY
jgi:hypothetical protein